MTDSSSVFGDERASIAHADAQRRHLRDARFLRELGPELRVDERTVDALALVLVRLEQLLEHGVAPVLDEGVDLDGLGEPVEHLERLLGEAVHARALMSMRLW